MSYPIVVITGDLIPPPQREQSQSHFLRVYDTVFPYEYLTPMKQVPSSGYEQFQGFAMIGARISLAVQRFWAGSYAMHAPGPEFATGFVTFSRPAGPRPAFTIDAGSQVATLDGRVYVTTEVATFGLGDATASPANVAVRAIARGYDYNMEGQVTAANGEILPGEVVVPLHLYQTPAYADPTIEVSQVQPITGGVCGALDLVAYDRGIMRQVGEPDSSLRLRARTLPDTVTPAAIRRQLAAYLDPYGIGWRYVEPWSLLYQTCWDAPSPNVGTPTYQATPPANLLYNSNLFSWDEPITQNKFRNFWLEPSDQRGAFIIFLQMPPEVSPGVFLYPAFASQDEQNAFMRGMVDLVNQIKPAGVTVAYKVYR